MSATGSTFRTMADEFLALQRRNGRAGVTLTKTEWLLDFAYPTLGDKPIVDIRPPDVLDILRKVENRGRFETARRLRSTIGRVFRFAVATGRAEIDPTYALHGTLARPPVQSHAAVTDAKAFGALLRAIDGFDGQPTTSAALKLMALLFPRPGELRGAEWAELNFDTAIWTVPGSSRTKLRRAHQVPLSSQAMTILNRPEAHNGGWPLCISVGSNGEKADIGEHAECCLAPPWLCQG